MMEQQAPPPVWPPHCVVVALETPNRAAVPGKRELRELQRARAAKAGLRVAHLNCLDALACGNIPLLQQASNRNVANLELRFRDDAIQALAILRQFQLLSRHLLLGTTLIAAQ